jgi:acetyl esterase/lipase
VTPPGSQGRVALTRRALLTSAATVSTLAATGCAAAPGAPSRTASLDRSAYGPDPSQFGDLYLPDRTPLATVVVIHGGYWLNGFNLAPMAPMSQTLQAAGYAVWNLEYRRLYGAGGWPMTFEDVAAGIDHLARLDSVDTDEVTLIGHSAGGQLAVWAASRTDASPGGRSAVGFRQCVSLAGVLDLTTASREGLGSGNVDLLMGGTPAEVPDRYRVGDPTLMVPAGCPVHCLRGADDTVVPAEQSTAYVAAAKVAGGSASFRSVPGDHSTIINPTGESWSTILELLEA